MREPLSSGKSDLAIAGSYLAVYPLGIGLGVVATYAAIMGINASSYRVPDGGGGVILVLALNALPATLIGCALYYRLARRVRRTACPDSRHWRRFLPLYLIATLLIAVIAVAVWDNPANGMVAQLFIWPAMTAVGGAIGDWSAWRSSRGALAV